MTSLIRFNEVGGLRLDYKSLVLVQTLFVELVLYLVRNLSQVILGIK